MTTGPSRGPMPAAHTGGVDAEGPCRLPKDACPLVNRRSTRHAIRNRLLTSMGATVAIGLLMTAIVLVVGATTVRAMADDIARMDALDEAAHGLQTALFTQETYVFDYALSGRADAIDEFDAATATEEEANAKLEILAADLPVILAAGTTAHDAAIEWREEWAEPLMRSGVVGGVSSGSDLVIASEVLFRPAEAALENLTEALKAQRVDTFAQIDSAIPRLATIIIPLGVVMTVLLAALGVWLTRSISGPLSRMNRTVEALVAGEAVSFRAEREDEVGALAEVLERLRIEAGERYDMARLEGEHAGTFNQFAELTSFARDEADLVDAASRAIQRLLPTTRGDILLANPSQNRLTVGIAWGDDTPDVGSLVNVDRIDRCPGVRRSSAFVAGDLDDDMAVRCPAHPAKSGTVACVPMLALGKIVGVIHLESTNVDAFASGMLPLATRVAENTGLAMANARLMTTMEGQAMTDPLTGLANTRFFDPYLEQELKAARRDEQPLSVIMIDIDHFKEFNDTYGHPAGDEALRAFARVVGASTRTSDVAARYGGEEFIVALRHAAIDDAQAVAEKLRASIEQMVVELGPGRFARITASLGVATSGPLVQDQKALVSLADAALYQAKERGRNRVELAPNVTGVADLGAAGRRRQSSTASRKLTAVEPAAS